MQHVRKSMDLSINDLIMSTISIGIYLFISKRLHKGHNNFEKEKEIYFDVRPNIYIV